MIVALVLLTLATAAGLWYADKRAIERSHTVEMEILQRIAAVQAGVSAQSGLLTRLDDNTRAARSDLDTLAGASAALPAALDALRGEFKHALERLEEKQDIPEEVTPSQAQALMRVQSVRAQMEANEAASYQEWASRIGGGRSDR